VQFFQLPVAKLVGTELVDVVVVAGGVVLVLFDVVVVVEPTVVGPTHMTWPTCMSQFASSHVL
jgi:hypothetical protein